MAKSINFEGLRALSVNAVARQRWDDYVVSIDVLYMRLSFIYAQLVHLGGLQFSEGSPIVLYGNEEALNWQPPESPQSLSMADVIAVLEATFAGAMDAEDQLRQFLDVQESLHRLQLRQKRP